MYDSKCQDHHPGKTEELFRSKKNEKIWQWNVILDLQMKLEPEDPCIFLFYKICCWNKLWNLNEICGLYDLNMDFLNFVVRRISFSLGNSSNGSSCLIYSQLIYSQLIWKEKSVHTHIHVSRQREVWGREREWWRKCVS